jgi:hypothetical protein
MTNGEQGGQPERRATRFPYSKVSGNRPVTLVVGAVESLAVFITVPLCMYAFPNARRSSFGTLEGDVYRRGE